MSQLAGQLPYDFDQGITWNALINIAATGQQRRKVIAEIGCQTETAPKLLVQLDVLDRLTLVLVDRMGKLTVSAPPIASEKFAFRPLWIEAAAYATNPGSEGSLRTIRGHIRVDGKILSTLEVTGDFGGHTEGQQAIGATLQASDPATFSLFELAIAGKKLSDEDVANLYGYFQQKIEVPPHG